MKVKNIANSYYFDTYALIEIGKGNTNYKEYKDNIKIVLNKFNIMELCYFLIRERREQEIKEIFDKLSKFHIDPSDELYLEAAKMKHSYKEKKLSYIDCLGYCIAKHLKIRFLTGDEKFKNLQNVEFIK